jgi:hypothetical protein
MMNLVLEQSALQVPQACIIAAIKIIQALTRMQVMSGVTATGILQSKQQYLNHKYESCHLKQNGCVAYGTRQEVLAWQFCDLLLLC